MTSDILIRFLNAGLINVGGDDAKLERLKETSADLAAVLKKTPSKTTAFALIAFDPEAPIDDPVIKEVVAALQNRWATYVNTFSGTPVAVIRAMLLDALVQAASEVDNVGVAFATSARNALPFMEAGNERAIWGDVVADIERQVDARAESEWATPESINVPAMQYAAPEAVQVITSPPNIGKDMLVKRFEAVAGPSNAAGQGTGGNPNWPNNNQQWVTEFGTRMADVISEVAAAVIKGYQIKPIDLSGPLKNLSQAVTAHVDETLKAVSIATTGLQRRTNLIWWKEALYSPSVRISYRGIPITTAAALMSFDLHKQVPTFSPASVAAFLCEAVLSLPSADSARVRPIRDLLREALESPELARLREAAAQLVPEPVGRGPLLGLLRNNTDQRILDDGQFRALIGVSAETPLTAAEWATWLFRELQAARAAQEGMETKKRGRKS